MGAVRGSPWTSGPANMLCKILTGLSNRCLFLKLYHCSWDVYPGGFGFGQGVLNCPDIPDDEVLYWIQRTQICVPNSPLLSKVVPFIGITRQANIHKHFMMCAFQGKQFWQVARGARGHGTVHVMEEQVHGRSSDWWSHTSLPVPIYEVSTWRLMRCPAGCTGLFSWYMYSTVWHSLQCFDPCHTNTATILVLPWWPAWRSMRKASPKHVRMTICRNPSIAHCWQYWAYPMCFSTNRQSWVSDFWCWAICSRLDCRQWTGLTAFSLIVYWGQRPSLKAIWCILRLRDIRWILC